MANAKPILELEKIDVRYGPVKVIHGLSLEVFEKEIVALLGPNGAGKTTTVNSILGLVPPVSGRILLDGGEITGHKSHRVVKAGVAVVPEGRGIFPELTVSENLKTGLVFINDSPRLLEERKAYVYDKFPKLREREKQIAGTLSGGEQSMLSLSRAIMSRPRLLLMDEPSLGLAPNLIEECFDMIQEFNRDGTSVLLIEQNAAQALEICDRAYILQKGQIILQGGREELLSDEKVQQAYFTTG